MKKGKLTITDKELIIKKRQETRIEINKIKGCTLEKRKLYGSSFAVLFLTYIKNGNERTYKIVSEDLDDIKECSLWESYGEIKKNIT